MTAALLCGAVALVSWPARRTTRRVAAERRGERGSGATLLRRPPPGLVALGAAAVAAALSTPLVAVLSGVCSLLALRALAGLRRAAATESEVLALAESLAVLAAELTAGRSLAAAVATAVDTCPDPRTARAVAVTLLDGGRTAAADGPVARALDRVHGAVRLSVRTGCPLGAVLSAVADDLRARHRAGLELRSATAGPRASAAVLAGLPLVGLAMGSGIGADPWGVLTSTGPGQALLVAGVALEAAGLAWTGRLVRRAVTPSPAVGGPGG